MYIFLPTEISSWYKCIKERRESVVESSKSLEPSLQQFDTVNATVSGSLRFDKDPLVWGLQGKYLFPLTLPSFLPSTDRGTHTATGHSALVYHSSRLPLLALLQALYMCIIDVSGSGVTIKLGATGSYNWLARIAMYSQ